MTTLVFFICKTRLIILSTSKATYIKDLTHSKHKISTFGSTDVRTTVIIVINLIAY